jgi:hypothetical protein
MEAMDGTAAIESNRQALKRILVMLFGMLELGAGGGFTFPLRKGDGRPEAAPAEGTRPTAALTLPRRLYFAILRLLRPAEAAARRLIIAAAHGIVVALPMRRPKPEPAAKRGARAFLPVGPKRRRRSAPYISSLSLLDPPRRPFRIERRHGSAHGVPRISFLDFNRPFVPLPAPASPDGPIDAARLGSRLEALAAALDDLPGQAKRFARWKARHDAEVAADGPASDRSRRSSPLRRGRPPGGRLSRYDPTATHPRRIREVDEILAHAHALALYALERPRRDTS